MPHLRLVRPPQVPPATVAGTQSGWAAQILDIPGLPPPTLFAMNDDDPTGEDAVEEPSPTSDPDLLTLLAQVDALFDGQTAEDKHKIGAGFYFDADGTPRTRHGQLRSIPRD